MMTKLLPVVQQVIRLLVAHQYHELEALTGGERLSATEIRTAVAEYGRHLVEPPSEAYGLLVAVRVWVSEDETWFARMPLWTAEEGRSDLTVELTIIFRGGGATVELDGILVP
jgi:hypothetical protein